MTKPLFTSDNLPDGVFGEYRKTYTTPAVRMRGPFRCLTSEGNVAPCDDGWLAIDSRGFPYPINAPEFERTYTRTGAVTADGDAAPRDDARQLG
jgi:hypothetical protein